ncbi:hypothetical protein Csac_0024 [Caldicellulosiruptor saccharolyticus DSM 8903]|uniref:Uncharacterized protein n=1 Tax=Caldicellulosiruptor saccharolyticus (strain ATCC 43494 / DSM 8903 / Tp8T 6331) TaxID=351627 RepID=A4XFK0_CALS8|nr:MULTISPECIES: hypothetical protein [Caldicellulosiruptor]ABP65685.1 hypothetical protein Csac_0024 [Caldicellulosiruptor saccharolyticus DSM 8903]
MTITFFSEAVLENFKAVFGDVKIGMFTEISPTFEVFIDNLIQALKSINLNIKKEIVDDIIIEIKQVQVHYMGSSKNVTDVLRKLTFLYQRDFLECIVKCNIFLKSRADTTFAVKNLEVKYKPLQRYNDTVRTLAKEVLEYLPLRDMLEKDFEYTKKALEWIEDNGVVSS